MKIGVQLAGVNPKFWTAAAQAADEAGFESVWLPEHLVFPVKMSGSPHTGHAEPPIPSNTPAFDALLSLAAIAATTKDLRLGTNVYNIGLRHPFVTARAIATLDVLSGGRAMLGIGAAGAEAEARGLGLPFPPLAERFERLEEALRICRQMWSDDDGPFDGEHYHLGRTLNSPQPLSRPHPPILVGGSGERKTLRLVARYADACNLFDSPDLARKLDVLRDHCAAEGRDYDTIEKTVQTRFDLGAGGERVQETIDHLHELSELGFTVAHGSLEGVGTLRPLDLMGDRVIPAIERF
jgi:F420-dependent oxidoreductase-like protein